MVDQHIADAGILAHPEKNVDASLNETAIGVDLVDGILLAPHVHKFWTLIYWLRFWFMTRPQMTKQEAQAIFRPFDVVCLSEQALFCFLRLRVRCHTSSR